MSASKEKFSTSNSHHGHHIHNHKPLLLELSSFCVYNPAFGPNENDEHKKILFYFPRNTDIDVQIRHVGLMEAVGKFMNSFSDLDCRSVQSAQQLHVIYQPEVGFWMAMTLNLIRTHDPTRNAGDEVERMREEQPQDEVYYSILQRSYKMFRALCGPMALEVNESGADLQDRLRVFFTDYLLKMTFGQFDILYRFEGMSNLPTDRKTFLNLQSFLSSLSVQFSQIKHTLLLYSDLVVWNDLDLPQADTFTQYITQFLYPDQLEKEMQAIHHQSSSPSNQFSPAHMGRFCSGATRSLWKSDDGIKICTYLVDPETSEVSSYWLVVYSAAGATICLFLQDAGSQNSEFYRRLDSVLGPAMTTFATSLADQYAKQKGVSSYDSPAVHYVYVNDSNLSKKQTLVDRTQTVQVELLNALAGVDEDIRSRPEDTEIFAKIFHDCWVYGRRNLYRRLYAVVTQRNVDLVIAEDEIRKLCAKEFSSTYDTYL